MWEVAVLASLVALVVFHGTTERRGPDQWSSRLSTSTTEALGWLKRGICERVRRAPGDRRLHARVSIAAAAVLVAFAVGAAVASLGPAAEAVDASLEGSVGGPLGEADLGVLSPIGTASAHTVETTGNNGKAITDSGVIVGGKAGFVQNPVTGGYVENPVTTEPLFVPGASLDLRTGSSTDGPHHAGTLVDYAFTLEHENNDVEAEFNYLQEDPGPTSSVNVRTANLAAWLVTSDGTIVDENVGIDEGRVSVGGVDLEPGSYSVVLASEGPAEEALPQFVDATVLGPTVYDGRITIVDIG